MLCTLVGCEEKKEIPIINTKSEENIEAESYLSYNNEQVLINVVNNSNEIKSIVANVYIDDDYSEEIVGHYLKPKENIVLYMDIDNVEEPLKSLDVEVSFLDEDYDLEKQEVKNNLIASYEVFDDYTVDVTLKNKLKMKIDEVTANVVFYKDNIPLYAKKVYLMDFDESVTDTIEIPLQDNSEQAITGDYIKIYIDDIIINYELEEELESSD